MLYLQQYKNYCFLINNTSGKWAGFKYKKTEKISSGQISKSDFCKLFDNLKTKIELLKLYEHIEKEYKTVPTILTGLNYLVLHVSDQCNMSCKYCYAIDNLKDCKNHLMTSRTMIDAINYFYKKQKMTILFQGREPLTNFEEIKKVIEHFEGNDDLSFSIQTNGTLLNDEIINFFKKHNVSIGVSLDGINRHQNSLRVSDKKSLFTYNTLKLLKNNKQITPILIVHKKNVKNLVKISKIFGQNLKQSATFNFLFPTNSNKELSKYVVDNSTLFNEYKKLFLKSINIKTGNFNFFEKNLYLLYGRIVKRHINNYMCALSPCGAGRFCVSVNYNGDVYPCTVVNGQKDNYMGNIYKNTLSEIKKSKYELQKRDLNKISECKNCPVKIFCQGGGCSGLIYNEKKQINNLSYYCNFYKNMISFIMSYCVEATQKKFFIN